MHLEVCRKSKLRVDEISTGKALKVVDEQDFRRTHRETVLIEIAFVVHANIFTSEVVKDTI